MKLVSARRVNQCADETRHGFSWFGLVVALALLAALPVGAYFFWPFGNKGDMLQAPLTHKVQRTAFHHVVSERGEIESSSNVDVRCEVQSRAAGSSGGTVILEIIPEGTYVQKGDQIALLDSSALRDELIRQQITCNTSRAAVIQAESTLETAKISRQEYLKGTFKQEEQLLLSELAVAEENLRRAQDYLHYSELLAAKGYVTPLQLEADRFAVTKGEMDVATAKTKLGVLREYTKQKMLSQFDADISTAEANLESQQHSHQLDLDQKKIVEEQIAKCEVVAPADGQVVYATPEDRRGEEFVIEEGAVLRERQTIVRLPDPKKMRVKTEISEARIDMVRVGMPATVRVDALPDMELTGVVTKVNEYPEGSSWWSTVKKYTSHVAIDDPPPGLRPGMTAEVRVHVQYTEDVLQVPVQAVLERQGDHYCFVKKANGLEARPVTIGATNDKFVVVDGGVDENELVVMNPRNFTDYVDLPELKKQEAIATKMRTIAAANGSEATGGDQPADAGDGEKLAQADVPRNAADAEGQGGEGPDSASDRFKQMDTDGDGKLSKDEAPERLRQYFDALDSDKDGFIDQSEMSAAMARMRAMQQGGGPGGPGAPGGGTFGGGAGQ